MKQAGKGVQVEAGPVVIDSDDPQYTYAGVSIAIKLRVVSWPSILGCVRRGTSNWEVDRDFTGDLLASDDATYGDAAIGAIARFGSAEAFLRETVMPAINKWLREVYPLGVDVDPPEIDPEDAIALFQQALMKIRFTRSADGLVSATL